VRVHAEGVLRLAGVLVGGLLGFMANFLLLGLARVLPSHARETLVSGLAVLAYPVARFLALVVGWPFQAEAAMYLYMIAIPITFVLIGMIGGWAVARWR
jgi:hypothetical protein